MKSLYAIKKVSKTVLCNAEGKQLSQNSTKYYFMSN